MKVARAKVKVKDKLWYLCGLATSAINMQYQRSLYNISARFG